MWKVHGIESREAWLLEVGDPATKRSEPLDPLLVWFMAEHPNQPPLLRAAGVWRQEALGPASEASPPTTGSLVLLSW